MVWRNFGRGPIRRPMSANKIEPQELERRIFALETRLGVSKDSKRTFRKLTDLQWYATLNWVDPHRPIDQSKKAFAESIDMSRQCLYTFEGNENVKRAVRVLDNIIGSIRATNVLRVAMEKAEQGDHRFCKLILERYRAIDDVKEEEEEVDNSESWDMSLRKPNNPAKDKDNPDKMN